MGGESEEVRGFTVVLERVERHYDVLSDKVRSFDQKIDQGLQDVRRDMETEFADLKKGISALVKQLREHRHGQGPSATF